MLPHMSAIMSAAVYFYPYHRVPGRLARRPVVKKLWAPCKAPKNSVVAVEIPSVIMSAAVSLGTTGDYRATFDESGFPLTFYQGDPLFRVCQSADKK